MRWPNEDAARLRDIAHRITDDAAELARLRARLDQVAGAIGPDLDAVRLCQCSSGPSETYAYERPCIDCRERAVRAALADDEGGQR